MRLSVAPFQRVLVVRHRRLAGELQARGIIAPAVLQVSGQQMQHSAVETRLGVAGRLRDGFAIERQGILVLAVVGQQIGEVGERRGIVGLERDGVAIMFSGLREITQLAMSRAQGEPQFGRFGIAGQSRGEQRLCGLQLSLRAQQIGEADEGLQPCRVLRQHAAEEFLGRPRHAERARGVAEREEHARIGGY